jgi:hypothetical protein
VGQAAKTGGVAGAIVSGGIAIVQGCVDLANGRADAAEVAGTVIKASAKGGASGAAAGAAATVTSVGTVVATSALGMTGMAATVVTFGTPILVATAVGYVASEIFDWLFD